MEVVSNPSCTVSSLSQSTVVIEGGNYYADAYDLIATLTSAADGLFFDGHPDEITIRTSVDGATIETGQGRNASEPIQLSPGHRIVVNWEFVDPEDQDRTGLNELPEKWANVIVE
jgi:hypothetical protein